MSDKVPPALSRQIVRSVNANQSKNWKDLFNWDYKKVFNQISVSIPVEKRNIIIAASVTAAVSLGGYFTFRYLYYLLNKSNTSTTDSPLQRLRIKAATKRKRISTSGSNENVPDGVLNPSPMSTGYGRKTPCIAPYPLKLETFLRIHSIKYEVDFNCLEPRTSDAPWITLDLEDICDSQTCMKFLIERYSLDIDKCQDEETKANVRAYTHLLEHHLYWGIALWRWVYDGARSLSEIQLLPSKTLQVVPQVCKTVEQAAWFHGIGKKSPRDVTEEVIADLAALSSFLGTKSYFVFDKPCELDCTAFAMLSQLLWNMDGSPYEKVINSNHKNLVDFCWRMRTTYWPDWDLCLNNKPYED